VAVGGSTKLMTVHTSEEKSVEEVVHPDLAANTVLSIFVNTDFPVLKPPTCTATRLSVSYETQQICNTTPYFLLAMFPAIIHSDKPGLNLPAAQCRNESSPAFSNKRHQFSDVTSQQCFECPS